MKVSSKFDREVRHLESVHLKMMQVHQESDQQWAARVRVEARLGELKHLAAREFEAKCAARAQG